MTCRTYTFQGEDTHHCTAEHYAGRLGKRTHTRPRGDRYSSPHMRYLTKDWFDAVEAAISSIKLGNDTQFSVGQTVGSATWTIVFRSDGAVLARDRDPSTADVAFSQSFDTAQSIAAGTTNAHQAFLLGSIAITGDVALLVRERAAFVEVEDALRPVMELTTFD